MSCVFCDFSNGNIDKDRIIYQNEFVLAFKERNPQAPFHLLLIPKIHIETAKDINATNSFYIARIYEVAAQIAVERNMESYLLFTRVGEKAGQCVFHIHHHMVSNFNNKCILEVKND